MANGDEQNVECTYRSPQSVWRVRFEGRYNYGISHRDSHYARAIHSVHSDGAQHIKRGRFTALMSSRTAL